MSKRARPGDFRGSKSAKKKARTGRVNRRGFSSVARTRGAAVTGEMKQQDNGFSAALVAAAGWTGTEVDPATFNTLFAPIVGAGVDQRIGKSVKVLKIKIRGSITTAAQIDQTAADGSAQVRLCLVMDKQTNSAQMQGEDVMTVSSTAQLAVNTFQNINNFGRFQVLKDMTINLQNPNMTYDGTNIEQAGLVKTFKITHTFKVPVMVRFNATNGGTVADIVDNSFHVIANSSSTALAPTLHYISRVSYKE